MFLLLTFLSFSVAHAANITVTNTADSGAGSLRMAVTMASAGDVIVFAGSANGTISLSTGEITLDKNLSIVGNGIGNTVISGGNASRIFNVTNSAVVGLRLLTLADGMAAMSGGALQNMDGDVTLDEVLVTNSSAMGTAGTMGGGGVHNAGTMLIKNSFISNNDAVQGSGSGGGILNSLGGTLTVLRTMVNGNEANRAGGGIEEASGAEGGFTMREGTLSGNTVYASPGNGGGIHVGGGGTTSIALVTIDGNTAGQEGGGVWNAGNMTLGRNTITNNVALGTDADDGGGGVFNQSGTVTINGGMIAGNTATATFAEGNATNPGGPTDDSPGSGSGGGILTRMNTTLNVINVRIMNNEANRAGGGVEIRGGTVAFRGGVISGNTVYASPGNGGGMHTGGGTINIESTIFDRNTAGQEGGGVWNAGTMTLKRTRITNNVALGTDADDGGGGVFGKAGSIVITGGEISGNSATATFAEGNATEEDGPADDSPGSGSGGGILNAPGASITILGTTIVNNEANRAGGGIENANGSLQVRGGTISNNVVNTSPGNGGGIHLGGPESTASISGATITENSAGSEGGGVWNSTGTMTLKDNTIDDNVALGNMSENGGGGAYNDGGTMTIVRGSVSGNTATVGAASGGGILNAPGGTLRLNGVTVDGNETNRAGGGIEDASGTSGGFSVRGGSISNNIVNTSPGNGGGIHIGGGGDSDIAFTVIDGNTAGSEGGGVWNSGGTMTLGRVTISNNEAFGELTNAMEQNGGGGAYNDGGTMNIRGGSITGNMAVMGAGSGGGVLNAAGGTLSIQGVSITGNTANRAGGGIEDASGSGTMVSISSSLINDNTVNTSPGNGGGIHVGGDGSITVTGGTVSGNTAGAEGGGLWNNTGTMTVTGTVIDGNTATGNMSDHGGGGLFNNGGTMILDNVTVTTNTATGTGGSGGGLLSTDGTVTVSNATFDANTSVRAGGAVEQIDGEYVSTDVTYTNNITGGSPGNGGAFHTTAPNSALSSFTGGVMSGNSASNEGGALWNNALSLMTVESVMIMGNTVTNAGTSDAIAGGGGIYNNGGEVEVTTSTIAGNSAGTGTFSGGGGIANDVGGIFTLTSSTVSGNSTPGGGGGIANTMSTMTITNSTIADNSAGSGGGYAQASNGDLTVSGSAFSGNSANLGGGDFANDGTGVVTSLGFNLVEDDGSTFPATGSGTDIEGVSADLAPLANNGGTLTTHQPNCGSPLIDAGDSGDSSPDQIGQAVFGGTRDIGAFELQDPCTAGRFVTDGTELAGSTAEIQQVVSIFPNPAAGNHANVRIPASFDGNATLRIVRANGNLYGQRTVKAGLLVLPLADMPAGTYTVQVVDGDKMETTRLIVIK